MFERVLSFIARSIYHITSGKESLSLLYNRGAGELSCS